MVAAPPEKIIGVDDKPKSLGLGKPWRDPAAVYAPSTESESEKLVPRTSQGSQRSLPMDRSSSLISQRSSLSSQINLSHVPEDIEESMELQVVVIGSDATQRMEIIETICEQRQGNDCASPSSPTSSRRLRRSLSSTAEDSIELDMAGRTAFISTGGSHSSAVPGSSPRDQHARVHFEDRGVSFFDDLPQMKSRAQAQSTAFVFLFTAVDIDSLMNLETPLSQAIVCKPELAPLKVLLGYFPKASDVAVSAGEIQNFCSKHGFPHYFELHRDGASMKKLMARSIDEEATESDARPPTEFKEEVCKALTSIVHLIVQRLQGRGAEGNVGGRQVPERAEGSSGGCQGPQKSSKKSFARTCAIS